MYISWHAIVSELCKNSRPTNQTNNRINIYYCSKVTGPMPLHKRCCP